MFSSTEPLFEHFRDCFWPSIPRSEQFRPLRPPISDVFRNWKQTTFSAGRKFEGLKNADRHFPRF
ncbi:MAG TPA: hypothetical protein DC058_16630 [Planctomycetaceae bacterium]|nr:hypothetical protein [Planctomycetaceae bacterium]